jgi:CMP-N-acetylneuraminic acid synthetase
MSGTKGLVAMSGKTMKCIALIPARSGSKRVPNKNIRPLAGRPLMAYAIDAARKSEIFADVLVSTETEEYARIAQSYDASVPFLRPADFATAESPDIQWVSYTLWRLQGLGRTYDAFAILRPTSPFRTAETIKRAWVQFCAESEKIDSLRAVQKVSEHPGKMWRVVGNRRLQPLLPFDEGGVPWHSRQYHTLPEVWVQNASLEIAWTRVVTVTHSISGNVIAPFFTEGYEGEDVNSESDWERLESLIARGQVTMPQLFPIGVPESFRNVLAPPELLHAGIV